jgi:hypothetical protein
LKIGIGCCHSILAAVLLLCGYAQALINKDLDRFSLTHGCLSTSLTMSVTASQALVYDIFLLSRLNVCKERCEKPFVHTCKEGDNLIMYKYAY